MSGKRILLGSTAVLAIVTMLQLSAYTAGIPESIPWKEAGPFKHVDDSDPHRFSHELLLDQRAARLAPFASDAVSEDVGDVAVLVDNGKIFIQPRPGSSFDLRTPTNLRWTRVDADTFSVAFAPASFDPTIGATLPLSDDDTEPVALLFSFPFLGASYTTIHVNTDGNVTLGAGDAATTPRDAARLIGGRPRIAPLLNDLNPEAGGSIHASVRANEVVITWQNVPEFGTTNQNTFQLVLKSSGEIVYAYQRIDADFGVVGVAEGNNEGPINEIDLTADLPTTKDAGAIFEEFFPPILVKRMNVLEVARQFYKTHDDKYDFLVIFTDSVVDLGGAFAFHLGLKNETRGIGRGIFDRSALVGSQGELESVLNMNRIGLYWPDAAKMVDPPIQKFLSFRAPHGEFAAFLGPPGADQVSRRGRWFGTLHGDFGDFGSYTLGLNSAMSLMGQEAGHRWLAFTRFRHPTDPNPFAQFDLLGRQFAHWSFFFNVRVPASQFVGDSRASSMEGNVIVDLGSGASVQLPIPCTRPGESTFTTERNELVDGYTALDQYLMGLLPVSAVGPLWYVDEPRSPRSGLSLEGLRGALTTEDVIFCGKRVDLTVANIQAIHGPRNPANGDEVDTDALGRPVQDVKTMAFILVVDQGPPRSPAHASAIRQVDIFRRTWQTYANGRATNGLGSFDTSLNPKTH